MIALDLFAGSGWGVACQQLGIEEYGVEIMPEAIATREAAGMDTIFEDVWDGLVDRPKLINDELRAERRRVLGKLTAGEVLSHYEMLIASPPCQTFSVAGKGAGREALSEVLRIVGAIRDTTARGESFSADYLREYAKVLGDDRTALVLTPLLYALRDRPTYITFEQVPTVLPVWEACADVLRDVGYSVTTSILNAEQYGVPQTRKRAILIARRDGEEAAMPTPTHSRYYSRDPRRLDEGVQKWVSMAEALGWDAPHGRPSPTMTGGGRRPEEPSHSATEPARNFARTSLVSNYGTGGDPSKRGERFMTEPAATITSKADRGVWSERPATTVMGGSDVVAGPGRSEFVKGGVSRQNRPGSVKVTLEEAAALQSYPAEFIWDAPVPDPKKPGETKAPTKGKQFLQVGNAVPPLLAQAILAEIAAVAIANERREIAA